jgi:uncharacterized protein
MMDRHCPGKEVGSRPAAKTGERILQRSTRRTNIATDVSEFLERWNGIIDEKSARKRHLLWLAKRWRKHTGGDRRDGYGFCFSPHEKDFEDSIEPGVRALVCVIVRELGWITYSSCEGHRPSDTPESQDLTERRVGILPRNSDEAQVIGEVLASVLTCQTDYSWNDIVSLQAVEWTLVSKREKKAYPVIDLVFARAACVKWEDYTRAADLACEDIISWFRRESSRWQPRPENQLG